jgi:hypothetical protein
MMDCWHTQLRLVAQHFPDAQLRPMKDTRLARGGVFVYVSATVARRETACPLHVVSAFEQLGYTIIHIREPRE